MHGNAVPFYKHLDELKADQAHIAVTLPGVQFGPLRDQGTECAGIDRVIRHGELSPFCSQEYAGHVDPLIQQAGFDR